MPKKTSVVLCPKRLRHPEGATAQLDALQASQTFSEPVSLRHKTKRLELLFLMMGLPAGLAFVEARAVLLQSLGVGVDCRRWADVFLSELESSTIGLVAGHTYKCTSVLYRFEISIVAFITYHLQNVSSFSTLMSHEFFKKPSTISLLQ